MRVLQEQEFEPVGSNRVIHINVRIIAATSVDLVRRVEEGRFRDDLYYRLNVLSIRVPPLRERVTDMETLCESILEQIELRTGLPHRELLPDAIERLRQNEWRGNVRELHNVLEKVAMLSDKIRLSASDLDGLLPANLRSPPAASSAATALPSATLVTTRAEIIPYAEALAQFERQLLREALAATNGRVDEAAKRLGLGRATVYRKARALQLLS